MTTEKKYELYGGTDETDVLCASLEYRYSSYRRELTAEVRRLTERLGKCELALQRDAEGDHGQLVEQAGELRRRRHRDKVMNEMWWDATRAESTTQTMGS